MFTILSPYVVKLVTLDAILLYYSFSQVRLQHNESVVRFFKIYATSFLVTTVKND